MLMSAWPMLTSALTGSTLTQSRVNRSRVKAGPRVSQRVSPTGGTRMSVLCKRKKRKNVNRLEVELGFFSSWACCARSGPILLLLLSFSSSLFPLRLTVRSHASVVGGSRAAWSRSGATTVCVCVRVCVFAGHAELATPRT